MSDVQWRGESSSQDSGRTRKNHGSRTKDRIPRQSGDRCHTVQSHLYDLAPGATRSLKHTQPGIEDVLAELKVSLPQYAKKLGVDIDVLTRILDTSNAIDAFGPLAIDAKKLAEILEESQTLAEDEGEADLSMLAETVKRVAARKDPSVEAPFAKLLKYVAQVGVKAAATRRKNEAAENDSQPAATDDEPSA